MVGFASMGPSSFRAWSMGGERGVLGGIVERFATQGS